MKHIITAKSKVLPRSLGYTKFNKRVLRNATILFRTSEKNCNLKKDSNGKVLHYKRLKRSARHRRQFYCNKRENVVKACFQGEEMKVHSKYLRRSAYDKEEIW